MSGKQKLNAPKNQHENENLLIARSLTMILNCAAPAQIAANAPRTVTDFYLRLPTIYFNDSATIAERRARIEVEDRANGYFKLKPARNKAKMNTPKSRFSKTPATATSSSFPTSNARRFAEASCVFSNAAPTAGRTFRPAFFPRRAKPICCNTD